MTTALAMMSSGLDCGRENSNPELRISFKSNQPTRDRDLRRVRRVGSTKRKDLDGDMPNDVRENVVLGDESENCRGFSAWFEFELGDSNEGVMGGQGGQGGVKRGREEGGELRKRSKRIAAVNRGVDERDETQAVAGGALKDGDADDHTHSKYSPVDSNSSALLEGETLSFDGEEADAVNNVASKQYGYITVADDSASRVFTSSLPSVSSWECKTQEEEMQQFHSSTPDPVDLFPKETACLFSEDYGSGYHQWLREKELLQLKELQRTPNVNVDIGERAVLVGRILRMCDYLGYQRSTIFLAIRLMDRVIGRLNLEGEKRILTIACACLTLAIKFEEVQHDSLGLFSSASGGVFTIADLCKAEIEVTDYLKFEMVSINASHFEERICRAAGCDKQQQELVKYLTELTLLDARLLKMSPSMQTASCTFLARAVLLGPASKEGGRRFDVDRIWPESAQRITGFVPADLMKCVKLIHWLHRRAEETKECASTYQRYASEERLRVSSIVCLRPDELDMCWCSSEEA